jgi:hypothetical protein
VALAATNIGASTSGVDGAIYTVNVSAPTSDSWLVVDIFIRNTTTTVTTPALSGGGLTYNLETRIDSATVRTLFRFIAQVGASPGAFTLTVDATQANAQSQCQIHVTQVTGGDIGDLLVFTHAATNTGTSASNTLNAFANSANRHIQSVVNILGEAIDPEATSTELAENAQTENARLETNWGTVADTSPSATWATSVAWLAIASEMAVAGTPSGSAPIIIVAGV